MIDIRKRLEEEIRKLEYELKVELPKEIKKAREYGDLRENAEYKAAKERQSYVDARIAGLKRRVAALGLMNLDRIPRNKVGLGSTVTLNETGSGEEIIYEIVTPEEADPPGGRISVSSPIGKSLLNRAEGDAVTVRAPSGTKEYDIVKLVTVHDQVAAAQGEVDEEAPPQ
jgi:transcription elongation factor GreA